MRWSVSSKGHPEAVKDDIGKQFARVTLQAAGNVHEVAQIGLVQQLVNGELDNNAGQEAIHVEAGGSAWLGDTLNKQPGSSQVHVKVEPIYGFLHKLKAVASATVEQAGTAIGEAKFG